MYTYRVKVTVTEEHAAKYEGYIIPHIKDILNTGCFERASLGEEKYDLAPGCKVFVAEYFTDSADKIKTYLKDHAPKLRQDAIDTLGPIFTAERTISIQTNEFD